MLDKFKEEEVIYRYKYLPFDDGALKTLTEGTIKFTCPLDFNDPFDFLPHYDTKKIARIPGVRPDLFRAAGNRRGLSPAQRLQQKGQFIARLRNRIDDGSFASDMASNVGVVSLSRKPLSILMWSHYANFHRGFLLEFRIPVLGTLEDSLLARDRLLPLPVQYSHIRPTIDIGEQESYGFLQKIALAKSLDWEYEAEERVIDHERGPGIFKYRRDDILCSVIAGMRMNNDDHEKLHSIIRNLTIGPLPSLKMYRATQAKDKYALEILGHPRITNEYFEAK